MTRANDEPIGLPSRARDAVVLFPGQGTFDKELLGVLALRDAAAAARLALADDVAQRHFGERLLPLSRGQRSPALDQLGIFLQGVELARELERRDVPIGVLFGHSFGEYAALATAEVFDFETGLEIVARRTLALAAFEGARAQKGGLAALSAGLPKTEDLLAQVARPSLEIAVLNHPRQTVVAGLADDLEALTEIAAQRGITTTRIETPFPFHSSHLRACRDQFLPALAAIPFAPPRRLVYLASAGGLLSAEHDLASLANVLAEQFVRRFDFASGVKALAHLGYRRFVEAGRSGALARLVGRNLSAQTQGDSQAAFSFFPAVGLLEPRAALDAAVDRPTALALDTASFERGLSHSVERLRAPLARAAPAVHPPRAVRLEPIAIVAQGAVLPGAANVRALWRNLLVGTSGIVDLAKLDPDLGADLIAGSVNGTIEVIPDKTYTLLSGAIRTSELDADREGNQIDARAGARTRGQRLLARALDPLLSQLAGTQRRMQANRARVFLGATADGIAELDEALFAASVQRALANLALDAATQGRLTKRLEQRLGSSDFSPLAQDQIYRSVVSRLWGQDVPTLVIDSACSSSLYALDLAIRALRTRSIDLAIAGGVFAPGPANNALFAQFRGLSPHGSRPLDARADGVVFGDGAAVVALARLEDALSLGLPILGVIRAIGTSSDGKSPAINVPQVAGQRLAIRRAYRQSEIEPSSIDLVEAHATATPVGDAVEIQALRAELTGNGESSESIRPFQLGSVKSLLGHTGWVSGAASLIKILQAFAHDSIPPQHGFSSAAPTLGLDDSSFEVSERTLPWPARAESEPRRAAIDGFGFGGTNAHVVVEAFDEKYHRPLAEHFGRGSASTHGARTSDRRWVVLAAEGLFPAEVNLMSPLPTRTSRFDRSRLALPQGKRLLPDVVEHMDASQLLAALAADRLLSSLPPSWTSLREETAVILGLSGKTERGIRANERIFRDRLRRLLDQDQGRVPNEEGIADKFDRLHAAAILDALGRASLPSGPYTLSGLMPNLAASRVASLFDLKGPNLVVDDGKHSFEQALAVAALFLVDGPASGCRLALVGAVHAAAQTSGKDNEAAVLVAVAEELTAQEFGLPILARLSWPPIEQKLRSISPSSSESRDFRGATGAAEFLAALSEAARGETVELKLTPEGDRLCLSSANTTASEKPESSTESTQTEAAPAFLTHSAIETFRTVRVESPLGPRDRPAPRRLVVLVDDPSLARALDSTSAWNQRILTVLAPGEAGIDRGLARPIDLTTEANALADLAAAWKQHGTEFDALIAISILSFDRPNLLLEETRSAGLALLELLFLVCRERSQAIEMGSLAVASLMLQAFDSQNLCPRTGLWGGFVRSLAREAPKARVRALHLDHGDLERALATLDHELEHKLAENDVPEALWIGRDPARRETFALTPHPEIALAGPPRLDEHSIVLATGGARGVTAVLVEEILERFGATVVAIGRSNPSDLPEGWPAVGEAAMQENVALHEAEFYRQEIARSPGQKMADLKRRFAELVARGEVANAVSQFENRCRTRGRGRFFYRVADLKSTADVTRVIQEIEREIGPVDWILHGAGVQVSKLLAKKSLADFRQIVETKVSGLGAILRALERSRPRRVHVHVATSAFSVLGNDGQPDYGAANQALDRLVQALDGHGASWSSIAWLGWAGIGMTRGSEFAALAERRRLRGVTAPEGRALFGQLLAGRPSAATTVLLAEGERAHYRPRTVAAPHNARTLVPLSIDLDSAPFLTDHRVAGNPTLPGAFLLRLGAEAALSLRPDLKVVAFENTTFRRFVRVNLGRSTELRLEVSTLSQSRTEAHLAVRVLSDFVHKSGRVLERDVVHTEIELRLAAVTTEARAPGAPEISTLLEELGEMPAGGDRLPDPYLDERSPVHLDGSFRCLSELTVGATTRSALCRPPRVATSALPFERRLPNVLLVDAFWRFGTVLPSRDSFGRSALGVYVPERCRRMRVFFDDAETEHLPSPITFRGKNPTSDGEQLHVGPIAAFDADGRLLLTVEGGVCRHFGEVPYEFDTAVRHLVEPLAEHSLGVASERGRPVG